MGKFDDIKTLSKFDKFASNKFQDIQDELDQTKKEIKTEVNKLFTDLEKKIPTPEEIAKKVKPPKPDVKIIQREIKEFIDTDKVVKDVLSLLPAFDVPEPGKDGKSFEGEFSINESGDLVLQDDGSTKVIGKVRGEDGLSVFDRPRLNVQQITSDDGTIVVTDDNEADIGGVGVVDLSGRRDVTKVTGNYTVLSNDIIIEALVTSLARMTLIDPTTNNGAEFGFVNDYSSTANMDFSRTVNGIAAGSFLLAIGESANIYSNGTEYKII